MNKKKYWVCTVFAWLFCVGIPIAATLSFFPLWVDKGSAATVSGTAVIFILLSVIPIVKYSKQIFKSIYSSVLIWIILLGLFIVLENIISQMIIVCEVAVVSNIIATILFVLAKKYKPLEVIPNG